MGVRVNNLYFKSDRFGEEFWLPRAINRFQPQPTGR